jgi:DNA-directed RNA polymerase subunit RPC12/RpoP
MSQIETFFRRCPNCGRRFEIKLVSKTLVDSEDITEGRPLREDEFSATPDGYLDVSETKPSIVEFEKFKYAYRCKHCGHQWVEIKEKEVRES